MKNFKLSKDVVRKVIETVDAGLSHGLGVKEPGNMCVEAAVCYALGLPHGDDPKCVDYAIRVLKIALNDSAWSSKKSRASGMRKLAVLQLGTTDDFDSTRFAKEAAQLSARYSKEAKRTAQYAKYAAEAAQYAKYAAEAAQFAQYAESAKFAAESAEFAAEAAQYAAESAARAAESARYAAGSAARDKVLANFAEDVAQILIEMDVPAVKYLYLLGE